MEIKKSANRSVVCEEIHNKEIACSACGRVLMSPYEGIVGDNNIAFCDSCYKNLLFPNFHEHYTEMAD